MGVFWCETSGTLITGDRIPEIPSPATHYIYRFRLIRDRISRLTASNLAGTTLNHEIDNYMMLSTGKTDIICNILRYKLSYVQHIAF